MSLQFTAERSLTRSKLDDRGRVVPALTVTGCGSPALNTVCLGFASPAWWPCESGLWWNQGLAGSCMYWSMRGAAPFCAACTVIAP
jgi:hypothetical protein